MQDRLSAQAAGVYLESRYLDSGLARQESVDTGSQGKGALMLPQCSCSQVSADQRAAARGVCADTCPLQCSAAQCSAVNPK